MSDSYKIDSHKLIYHPGRVAQWLDGHFAWEQARTIYPIYIEVSPSGGCNHRCEFCAMDYVGYKNRSFDPAIWEITTTIMAEKGVKSIMLAGEGEPFLNKNACDMAITAKGKGIDVAFTTNGVLMDRRQVDRILPVTSWIKVSMDAGTEATYAAIRKCRESDFGKVIENLAYAVKIRKRENLSCTLGAQMILLPENAHEIEALVMLCRDEIGLDYLVIKPYSQHLHSHNDKYASLDYSMLVDCAQQAESMSTDRFKVIFRKQAFDKTGNEGHGHDMCCSIPFFWTHIMANHDVYACSSHLMDERFHLGNLTRQSFSEIWEGEKRRQLFEHMKSFDIKQCRVNCRMTFINDYLWALKNPHPHVNFI